MVVARVKHMLVSLQSDERCEHGAEAIALALTLPMMFVAIMAAVQLGLNSMYMSTLTAELEQAADYVDVSSFSTMSDSEKNEAVAAQLKAYGLTLGTMSQIDPDSLVVTEATYTSNDAASHDTKAFNPYSSTYDYSGTGSWTKDEQVEQNRTLYKDVNDNGQYDEEIDTVEGQTSDGVDPSRQTIITTMTKSETCGILRFKVTFKSPSIIHAFGLDDMTYEKTIARERVTEKQVEVQAQ